MIAISIWEPWATLIALGLKRYETRWWRTDYWGPLLICASKKKIPVIEIASILFSAKLTPDDLYYLHYGKAVAIVDLVTCIRTDCADWENIRDLGLERKLGDWSPGRWAWKLENIRRFIDPPFIKGKPGLFEVPDELIKDLKTYDPI